MEMTNTVRPVDAFRFLLEQNLPLILSFPLVEEKGHIITGKGICYVEKIHGASRITLGRFSPFRMVHALGKSGSFYATFEFQGRTFGCMMEDVLADRTTVVVNLPAEISPFLRKFVRVEPSISSPVLFYVNPDDSGTLALAARDLSEHGVGLLSERPLPLDGIVTCGIRLPMEGGVFLLTTARRVYQKPVHGPASSQDRRVRSGVSCGLEIFPRGEDLKRVRLYIMQRELEIRHRIQQEW